MTPSNYQSFLPYLKKLGLSESEASSYLSLHELGSSHTSGTLAKRANLKRSTTAMALKSLKRRGLVTSLQKHSCNYYRAEPAQKLLAYLRLKQLNLDALQTDLENMLPHLKQFAAIEDAKPKIKIYEGIEAIQNLFLEMTNIKGELLIYFGFSKRIDTHFNDFWPEYFKKIKEKNKKMKAIAANNERGLSLQKKDQKENRQTLLVPPDEFAFEKSITGKHIIGDTVAQIILERNTLKALLVKDENFAETEKYFFKLVWDSFEGKP